MFCSDLVKFYLKHRYNPESDGRILLAKVDCTQNQALCRKHHIQGYPSIRIFRRGHDLRSVLITECVPLEEG
jgi:thioredoxin-like negative regulator of GroEL